MSEADLFPEKKLLLGGFAGLAAAIIGAIIWAVVTVTTKYQIGWMALGVGALIAFASGGEQAAFFTMLNKADPSKVISAMWEDFISGSFLFYVIAAYEGYK